MLVALIGAHPWVVFIPPNYKECYSDWYNKNIILFWSMGLDNWWNEVEIFFSQDEKSMISPRQIIFIDTKQMHLYEH